MSHNYICAGTLSRVLLIHSSVCGQVHICFCFNVRQSFLVPGGMKIADCRQVQLIQIFLPLYNNDKQRFDRSLYDDLENRLKDQFGGITFYRNAPAEGLWRNETGKIDFDELIIAEVMITDINKEWWEQFKRRLEQVFDQDKILIRSIVFEKL